jgi:sortase A
MTYRYFASKSGVKDFESAKRAAEATVPVVPKPGLSMPSTQAVDFSLWSEKRVAAYKDTLKMDFTPVGVLRIQKLGIEVPVFDGTDEVILNRGVGRIIGSARVGEVGNVGIAGHRDGFFRPLKDIKVGDTLTLDTMAGTEVYAVDNITLTIPDDVSVLASTTKPTLTLVTCYPFYFIGDAPQRYIVRCSLKEKAGVKSASVATGASDAR